MFTSFVMGVLSQFNTASFKDTSSPFLTSAQFIFFMLTVLVISLNALIAILGNSFDAVMGRSAAELNRQTAALIVSLSRCFACRLKA